LKCPTGFQPIKNLQGKENQGLAIGKKKILNG
jgi:hypothetical protein